MATQVGEDGVSRDPNMWDAANAQMQAVVDKLNSQSTDGSVYGLVPYDSSGSGRMKIAVVGKKEAPPPTAPKPPSAPKPKAPPKAPPTPKPPVAPRPGGGGGGTTPPPPSTGGGGGGGGGGTPIDTPSMGGLNDAASMSSGGGDAGMGAQFGSLRGPSRFRQGIGQRIPPQMSVSLAALKQIY